MGPSAYNNFDPKITCQSRNLWFVAFFLLSPIIVVKRMGAIRVELPINYQARQAQDMKARPFLVAKIGNANRFLIAFIRT